MSSHTKEPWIVTGGDRIKYIESRVENGILQEIASCMIVAHGNHEANARRIVACVNACEGVSDQHLEHIEMTGGIKAMMDRAVMNAVQDAFAAEQRDELLAALKIAVRQNSHDMLMTGEELRSCEAAIAKAEGK